MPQYHKWFLPRKMNSSVCTTVVLPSEFDSNELIFSLIGHELGELHEFYKMFQEMEVFPATPSIQQTAVKTNGLYRKHNWFND